jgi:hypothetical protein
VIESEVPRRRGRCGRPWDDPAERWRADWVDDEDDLHYWCPVSWVLEFAND